MSKSRSIVTCFHKYQPYGSEYYEPILDFYLQNLRKYKDEYDALYIVDSNWKVPHKKLYDMNATIYEVSPHKRYFDAYKEALSVVKEDAVLFLDNDMVIYKPGVIKKAFEKIECGCFDIVSIYDTIGTFHSPLLNDKSKFCLYFMTGKTELFKKYLDVDWGSHMPDYETLGLLTQKMLADKIRPFEFKEDKNSIYFDGVQDGEKSKDLGYMHLRSGSVPSVLLAWKQNAPKTYWEYIKGQPKTEYLRQCFWFDYMKRKTTEGIWKMSDMGMDFCLMLKDMGVEIEDWENYYDKCIEYYNLP